METDLVSRLKLYTRLMEEELALATEVKEHYSGVKNMLDGLEELRVSVASKELPFDDRKSLKSAIFGVYNQIDHNLAVASPECPQYQYERGPEIAIRDYSKIIQTYERVLRSLYELFPEIKAHQETTIQK